MFVKEQKTINANEKAIKSAEKNAISALKSTANKVKTITKARKVYWFEKFYWFISSENYLVIGGRDSQQNEQLVKRYLKPGDIYVHADIHGASSVVIKNPRGAGHAIPPKTLDEAGIMSICYSTAWEAKVLINAWWVHADQVSKQAPTGEYLTTGSFMIRGKKNFLPQTALVFGFGILYKLEESSVARHKSERRVKSVEEDEVDQKRFMLEEATEEEVAAPIEEEEVKVEEEEEGDAKVEGEQEEEEEDSQFPDTAFQMKLVNEKEVVEPEKESSDEEEEEPVESKLAEKLDLNEPAPLKQQRSRDENEEANKKTKSTQQVKRGQKARLNKMKTKYKDQDEEDRELHMQFIAVSSKLFNFFVHKGFFILIYTYI